MSHSNTSRKFYGWTLLPFLCLVYSIPIGFAFYGPPVINTFMVEDLKLHRGQINVGYSIIGIVLGLGALFIPWLINRFGPKKTLAIGAVLASVSSVLIALTGGILTDIGGQAYPLLYWLVCILIGLGVSFGSVVPVQALVLLWFNAHRALAMGLVLGGGAIGGFIYPQIISNCIIAFNNDWRVGWYIVAIACFIGAAIAMVTIKNRPEDIGQYPDGLSPDQVKENAILDKNKFIKTYRSPIDWAAKDAFKTHSFWLIIFATGIIFFLWQVLLTQAPAHLHDRGFSASDPVIFLQPAFIYGLTLACSIIGRLSVSILGERIEPRFIMASAAMFLVVGGGCFWLASRDNMWAVYIFPIFTGIGFGATYVSIPLIVGNYYGVNSFADLIRFINPVNAVFQFSAPAVAGFMFDINHSYGLTVAIACALGIIGAVSILFCTPPATPTKN